MEEKVTKGNKYLISTKAETTVTDPESGCSKVIPANSQTVVVALSDKFTIEGDYIIRPFADAHLLALGAGTGGGGSTSGDVEAQTYDRFLIISIQPKISASFESAYLIPQTINGITVTGYSLNNISTIVTTSQVCDVETLKSAILAERASMGHDFSQANFIGLK